jgi:hypothetical protein
MHTVDWSLAVISLSSSPRSLASCLDLLKCISSADWVCEFDIPTIVLWVTCIVCPETFRTTQFENIKS